MSVAVDLGSAAVKLVNRAIGTEVVRLDPVDPDLVANVGARVPLAQMNDVEGALQSAVDAYVGAVARTIGDRSSTTAVVLPDWWAPGPRSRVASALEAFPSGRVRAVSSAESAALAAKEHFELPTSLVVLDLGSESGCATPVVERDGVHRIAGRSVVQQGRVGGELDRRLLGLVVERLSAAGVSLDVQDPANADVRRALLDQVRHAKEELTQRELTAVSTHLRIGRVEVPIARSDFDELALPVLQESVGMIRRIAEAASAIDVQAVLVTGGIARVPLVRQLISDEFDVPVLIDDDASTLAVRGAVDLDLPEPAPQQERVLFVPPPRRDPVPAPWRAVDASGAVVTQPPVPVRAKRGLSRRRRREEEPDVRPLAPPAEIWPPELPADEIWPGEQPAAFAAPSVEAPPVEPQPVETQPVEAQPVQIPPAVVVPAPPVQVEPAPPPRLLDLVVEVDAEASWRGPEARWVDTARAGETSRIRLSTADADGELSVRVNGQDHPVPLGAEHASVPVVVMVERLHLLVSDPRSGALLRELTLDGSDGFRPE